MRKEQIITTNNNQMEEKGMKSRSEGVTVARLIYTT